MLSKSNIKYINSLKQKKFRQQFCKFTAEGDKIVHEIIQNPKIIIEKIFAVAEWIETNAKILHERQIPYEIITSDELKKISNLQTPNQALAVVEMITETIAPPLINSSLSLVLDTLQDPGNLGTIIRIADWFGIPYIFCAKDSVDVYNPKVIQASMGGFLRIKVIYTDIEALFDQFPHLPKYGAVLGGANIFETTLTQNGFIIIGNESKGISENIKNKLTHQLEIPAYGKAESLNAGVATGIICAIFRSQFQPTS